MKQKSGLSTRWLIFLASFCILSLIGIWIEFQRSEDSGLIVSQTVETVASNAEQRSMSTGATDSIGESGSQQESPTVTGREVIPVYLVGAVQNPGVYQIERGSYLFELLDRAGGLTPDAAAEETNLAMQITENQRIYIPTQAEIKSDPNLAIQGISSAPDPDEPININAATVDQLDNLPGIGPATAKAIVDFRNRNGPFAQTEDLMLVAGIKQSRFTALQDRICVQ